MVDRQKIIALLKRLATFEAAVGQLPKYDRVEVQKGNYMKGDYEIWGYSSTHVPELVAAYMDKPYADAIASLLRLAQGMK